MLKEERTKVPQNLSIISSVWHRREMSPKCERSPSRTDAFWDWREVFFMPDLGECVVRNSQQMFKNFGSRSNKSQVQILVYIWNFWSSSVILNVLRCSVYHQHLTLVAQESVSRSLVLGFITYLKLFISTRDSLRGLFWSYTFWVFTTADSDNISSIMALCMVQYSSTSEIDSTTACK